VLHGGFRDRPDDGIAFAADASAGDLTIRLAHVAAIRMAAEGGEDAGFAKARVEPPAATDHLFARDQSGVVRRYSMRVVGVGPDAVAVQADGKDRTLPFDRVYGIVFGRDNGAAPDPVPTPRARVAVGDDVSFEGRLRSWNGTTCVLELAEGLALELACETVRTIRIDSGLVAWLTDLAPAAVEQTPAFDRVWPWLADRTPNGPGIALGGRTWRRGLCLVPRVSIAFDVSAGSFDRFEATAGIDDRTSELAHAVLRVHVDGRLAFDSGPLVRGAAPQAVSIPLDGAHRLTLEADFGDNFDLGDHCVFADARLRKERR
jgi:hypothetical protein